MPEPPSSLDELFAGIRSASWFVRLGAYAGDGPGTPVSGSTWKALSRSNLAAEFGLESAPSRPRPIAIKDWLPTSRDLPDPVRGQELQSLERSRSLATEARNARLRVTRATMNSLRQMRQHPLLRVGAADYREAARSAATYAFRRAATELVLSSPGFWTSLIPIYSGGNWPFALDPADNLLVL